MSPIQKVFIICAAFALVTSVSLGAADHADHGAAAKPYPFDTCIVSGEAFGGEMGDPVVFTHEGREVKLCCKSCMKKFTKDPATFTTVIDAGIAAKAAGKDAVNPAAKADEHAGHDHGKAGHHDDDHGKDAAKDDKNHGE